MSRLACSNDRNDIKAMSYGMDLAVMFKVIASIVLTHGEHVDSTLSL